MPDTQTIRLSRPKMAPGVQAEAMSAPCAARPRLWLGAESSFGLALPDATPSDATMYAPRGVWLDDDRLVVCDSGNHRVLIWNSVPVDNHTPADVVLGQPDFATEGPNARGAGPENGFHLPTGVIVLDGKLLVADAWNHRVLVWRTMPDASGAPPDYAIGQGDLTQSDVNRGQAAASRRSMNWPYGIAWIRGRLYVADTGNRRVLAWEGLPDGDRPADLVLGQPDDTGSEENRGGPVAADSFRWPHDFAGVGDQLFIADAGNHRVLGWNKPPAVDRAADFLLGQEGFDRAYELPYDAQGPQRLRFPYAVASEGNVLAVADTANNRVLFWRAPLEPAVNAPAFDVVGQVDFASNGENRWQSVMPETLCWPYGLCLHRGVLAVADSGNNRVMLWDCEKVFNDAAEDR
ncbi:MAG: NHL repeat-containing protein [Planctomycetota bacterium]